MFYLSKSGKRKLGNKSFIGLVVVLLLLLYVLNLSLPSGFESISGSLVDSTSPQTPKEECFDDIYGSTKGFTRLSNYCVGADKISKKTISSFQKRFSCWKDDLKVEIVQCDCEFGLCKNQPSCSEDTQGNVLYQKFEEVLGASDACVGEKNLLDYYCDRGVMKKKTEFCIYGCISDGVQARCKDYKGATVAKKSIRVVER